MVLPAASTRLYAIDKGFIDLFIKFYITINLSFHYTKHQRQYYILGKIMKLTKRAITKALL